VASTQLSSSLRNHRKLRAVIGTCVKFLKSLPGPDMLSPPALGNGSEESDKTRAWHDIPIAFSRSLLVHPAMDSTSEPSKPPKCFGQQYIKEPSGNKASTKRNPFSPPTNRSSDRCPAYWSTFTTAYTDAVGRPGPPSITRHSQAGRPVLPSRLLS
jgi:hypothetical protein